MLYLLTQILLSLLLAAVTGGAFGWLLHRWRKQDESDHLHEAIVRLQRQLAQTDTDIALLNNDYDELLRQNQDELHSLRTENRELTPLRQNLEKSQLLVRQMLQQHESETGDLKAEVSDLRQRLKQLAAPSRERTRVLEDNAAPAASSVQELSADRAAGVEENAGDLTLDVSSEIRFLVEADADADSDTDTDVTSTASTEGGGETRHVDADNADRAATTASADTGSTGPAHVSPEPSQDASLPARRSWASVPLPDVIADSSDSELPRASANDDDALTPGSLADEPLFNSVDQIDDLQQIVGIGPVTEQALNRLGITSYSQLAELGHHQIEKIATALDIVPARIERDDWVGAARRQLEEVLEGL